MYPLSPICTVTVLVDLVHIFFIFNLISSNFSKFIVSGGLYNRLPFSYSSNIHFFFLNGIRFTYLNYYKFSSVYTGLVGFLLFYFVILL